MKAEYVNAFIDATLETLQSMCRVKFHRTGPLRRVGGEIVDSEELMAICGLTGDVKGAVMLATPLETGKKLEKEEGLEQKKEHIHEPIEKPTINIKPESKIKQSKKEKMTIPRTGKKQ